MKSFFIDPSQREYEWHRLSKEIEYLEKHFEA